MDYDRKKIKKEAHKNLKMAYYKSILVMFIVSLIMSNGHIYGSNINNDTSNLPFNTVEKVLNNSKKNKESTRGVLAPLIKKMTADKSAIISFINSFKLIYYEHNIKAGLISFVTATILFLIYVFVKLILDIGKIRYFLETRRYKATKIDKILFPYRTKKIIHLSSILFIKNLFETLWDLTIIGGIIKHYEYMMIPYVLSENPAVSRKEAFRLSKELMKGYKWKVFKTHITMIGWFMLSILTFGISDIFYTNAYREFIDAEIYMKLRKEKDRLTDGPLLCDNYLDVQLSNGEYPTSKYIIPLWKYKDFKSDYNQSYSIIIYTLFFFTFAFIGWLWEVILNLVTSGTFANRGVLYGPWLPIYGVGAVMILVLLKPFRKQPIKYFIISCILAGILEYSTAWYLETFKHMKWWDYTGYFLNLHGRICLEGLLVFGLGGAALTYFIAPMLSYIYKLIKKPIAIIMCVVLLMLFVIDTIYSFDHPNAGEGITSYEKMLIKDIHF